MPEEKYDGCLAGVLRLYWSVGGSFLLFFVAAGVAKGAASIVMEVLLAAVAASLILARYVDIRVFAGVTADGNPATLADWRRYSAWLAVIAVGLWVVARFVASKGWF